MRALAILVALAACGDPPPAAPPRTLTLDATVDASGLSEELAFEIPDATRSITVVVEGEPGALYALGGFALGDGADRVGLPAGAPGPAMQASYHDEQIGRMPGALYQAIRLGTFTHVYPYRPDQAVVPGAGRLRVASDRPGPVRVTIVMPEDDGAAVLPLALWVVSDTLPELDTPAVRGELARIFAQASLEVRIDRVERLTGTGLEQITELTEPQETPASQAAMLATLATDDPSAALDVFVVEDLPAGVRGLSLGTPGPPLRGSYYYGVLVRGTLPAIDLARVTAHEVAHFLALQHVQNRGVSGELYPDPLDDTTPGTGNLMESGTVLTPDQAFGLSRSALLAIE